MSEPVVVGVDLGGTTAKLGLVGADGTILATDQIPVATIGSFDALRAGLVAAITGLEASAGCAAVAMGIATPGWSDPVSGSLRDGGGNIRSIMGRSLSGALSEALGRPAVALNDGVAAAIGEQRFGAGRSYRSFALITIGTGIGGAVVIDGRCAIGAGGQPPEIGATRVCVDGRMSSLEEVAAAPAMLRGYHARGGDAGVRTPREMVARLPGDALAREAIEAAACGLAQVGGGLTNALALEAILIGGGLSHAGDALLLPIERQLRSHTWPLLLDLLELRRASLGNLAGVVGAASAAQRRFGAAAEVIPSP